MPKIVARMMRDWVKPYSEQSEFSNKIPVVVDSDHPRYTNASRFDWGFVQTAIGDGYEVTITPYGVNRSNCKHERGFDRCYIIMGSGGKDYDEYGCPICGANRYIVRTRMKPKHLPTNHPWAKTDD